MKWYWWLYLFLLIALGYGQLFRKVLTETGGVPSRYGAAIVATIVVIALVAKSREIALGKIWMWKMLFFILAIGSAIMILFSIYLGVIGVYFSAGLLIVGAVVLLPAIQELYAYSYRSPKIWA